MKKRHGILVTFVVAAGLLLFGAPKASAVTCTLDGTLTGPGERTSSNDYEIQLIVLAPYGVAHENTFDRPQYCDDGSFIKSKASKSTLNSMDWQYDEGAGTKYDYDAHFYTSPDHWERSVRRYTETSSTKTASWYASGGACSMLSRVRTSIHAAGFTLDDYNGNEANTMYMVVVHASAPNSFIGCADTPGYVGNVYRNDQNGDSYQFSCTNVNIADPLLMHESTHLMGATHVTSPSSDLMYGSAGPTLNNTTWGDAAYGNTVRLRAYSDEPGSATTRYTC